jgi:hypothetical protein
MSFLYKKTRDEATPWPFLCAKTIGKANFEAEWQKILSYFLALYQENVVSLHPKYICQNV